jgi:hypothetical protein
MTKHVLPRDTMSYLQIFDYPRILAIKNILSFIIKSISEAGKCFIMCALGPMKLSM